MNAKKPKTPKTLADLPHFRVLGVVRGETDPDGFTAFELEGEFDRIIERQGEITWFWLLSDQRSAICVQWKSEDDESLKAVVVAHEKKLPEVLGKTLYYLSPGWDPKNIWMVTDDQWGWESARLQAVDAVAETYAAKDISIVDGREVKTWTKLTRADGRGSVERYGPSEDKSSGSGTHTKIIPGGWDHEHCQLCRKHIDDGDYGYRDRDDHWMCVSCYDSYVRPRDVSFVDDL
jgi:hypothetical protein